MSEVPAIACGQSIGRRDWRAGTTKSSIPRCTSEPVHNSSRLHLLQEEALPPDRIAGVVPGRHMLQEILPLAAADAAVGRERPFDRVTHGPSSVAFLLALLEQFEQGIPVGWGRRLPEHAAGIAWLSRQRRSLPSRGHLVGKLQELECIGAEGFRQGADGLGPREITRLAVLDLRQVCEIDPDGPGELPERQAFRLSEFSQTQAKFHFRGALLLGFRDTRISIRPR